MHQKMLALAGLALFFVAGMAGCLDDTGDAGLTSETVDTDMLVNGLLNLTALAAPVNFTESVVDAAVSYANDLYEPTMEVSDDGSIFITGHTILVDTTGAPVFGSWDGGESWEQLPFFMDQQMPADVHGATPPPSDEIFLVAGDDGWLYGVDITLATFPVNAWNDDGRYHAYHNPNAYDEHQVALQASDCIAAPAKDRPWAAYADGSLLMVSNPAAGPVQIGILDVPSGPLGFGPTGPYTAGIGATTGGGHWNLCAGTGYHTADCRIPGIPDMADDGTFAVPQLCGNALHLVTGHKHNIMNVDVQEVFPVTSGGEITSVYGQAAFDKQGTLFVGITNNTAPGEDDLREGRMHFAVSHDYGVSFEEATFSTGPGAVRHFYMDANRFGPGSLVVWAVDGNTTNDDGDATRWDWYAGHLMSTDGGLVMENIMQFIDEGPRPSAHVTGAALGPDGRAYSAMFDTGREDGTPMSVYIQQGGAFMPVTE